MNLQTAAVIVVACKQVYQRSLLLYRIRFVVSELRLSASLPFDFSDATIMIIKNKDFLLLSHLRFLQLKLLKNLIIFESSLLTSSF